MPWKRKKRNTRHRSVLATPCCATTPTGANGGTPSPLPSAIKPPSTPSAPCANASKTKPSGSAVDDSFFKVVVPEWAASVVLVRFLQHHHQKTRRLPQVSLQVSRKLDYQRGLGGRGSGEGVDFAVGSDVGGRQPAVDEEVGAGAVGGVVGGEEECRACHFVREAEAAHGHVDEAPLLLFRRVEETLQERRVEGTGAEAVDANVLARMDDRQFSRHGQNRALGGRVRELRRRCASQSDEARRVDDGAAAGAAQRGNAVLAAVEDALDVDVERTVPNFVARLHRVVVRA
mmetsp:Transcript_7931/g.24484  ORF Transcript_7931/g.24484 Transcript_7931/m.24484 type:complete len:288 (+) Transcript_7931:476-1339(+)